MRREQKLEVFIKADELVYKIFEFSNSFPEDEEEIGSEIIHAAISIASNLGAGIDLGKEGFEEFLDTASYSVSRLLRLLKRAKNTGFITLIQYDLLITKSEKIKKMIYKLMLPEKGVAGVKSQ